MKTFSTVKNLVLVGVVTGLLSHSAVAADNKKISKPQGAIGMGKVAPNQAKSNLFWWPDSLDLTLSA